MEKIILNSIQGAARNVVYCHAVTTDFQNRKQFLFAEPCDYLVVVNGGSGSIIFPDSNINQQGVILSNNSVFYLSEANVALPPFWIIRGPNGLKIKEFWLKPTSSTSAAQEARVAAYWL